MDTEDVIVEIDLDADLDQVWEALTSPDGLSPWLGDGADIDAVPGGDLTAPDIVTGRPRRGRVDEVDPGERLTFTWWPEDDPGEQSSVTFVVEPGPDRTHLTVIETVPVCALTARARPTMRTASWAWRAALLTVSRSMACGRSAR